MLSSGSPDTRSLSLPSTDDINQNGDAWTLLHISKSVSSECIRLMFIPNTPQLYLCLIDSHNNTIQWADSNARCMQNPQHRDAKQLSPDILKHLAIQMNI